MNKALEWLLIAVVVGSTLAFGGVQPVAYSLVEVALFLGFLALLWHQTREGQIEIRLPIWPLLFAFLIALQLIPMPQSQIVRLSPARFVGPAEAGWPATPLSATLSIYPY